MSNRFLSLFASILVVMVAACLLAPRADARDLSEYGYYLGVRLRMYNEAENVLRKQMDGGTPEEKGKARSALARVYKSWGEDEFVKTGDESVRNRYYEKAEELYSNPETQAQRIELAVLRLEIARAKGRSDPEGARALVAKALEVLTAEQPLLEAERSKYQAEEEFFASAFGPLYKTCVYHVCLAYYVNGLTYPDGSADRLSFFKKASDQVQEAVFLLPTSIEYIDAMLLLGEIERSARKFEGAVAKYLDVPSYLSEFPANFDVGQQALRGWLKAAEIMTSELGYDKKFLQKCIDEYQKASTRYGGVKDLATDFKRFKLYQIGAQIKLGGDIAATLTELFALAADNDISFKRQALTVLADIGGSDDLDAETRLRCGRAVLKDALVVGYIPIFKVMRAYQVLLSQCNNVQAFESYAPECYRQLGVIFSDLLHRYVDAATLYREAALRTTYFQKKFGKNGEEPAAGEAIPAHLKDKSGAPYCELIADTKGAYNFPGEMAKNYAKVAGWLTSSRFGDPKNAEFARMKDDADVLKARLSGREARLDLDFNKASEKYNKKQYGPAAVRFASLPADYKKFRLALYYAANAYMAQIEDPSARHPSRFGDDEEQESSEYFAKQKARHAEDLAALPKELWEHVEESHFEAMNSGTIKGDVAIWHKAVYYFKKYMLVVALRNWEDIKERVDVKKHDCIDAFLSVVEVMAERWRAQPERSRQPSEEMEIMGRAAYGLAFLLRNPAKNEPNKEATLNAGRPTALRILRRHWDLFGPHFAASGTDVQKAVLNLSFGCLADEKDGEGCETILKAYEAAFGSTEEGKKKIAQYIAQIYIVYLDTLDPKVQALNAASTSLRSLFNQLKLGLFQTEAMFLKDAAAAKRFADAKTTVEKDRVMAQFFWDHWIGERALGGDPKKNLAASVGPEVIAMLKQKWEAYSEFYPRRWGEAQKAEFDALIKAESYNAIRSEAQKIVGGAPATEIADKIEAQKGEAWSTLALQIRLNTSHLRYFTGTTFIYDFGSFLEETSGTLDERMRPMLTKVLTFYERYQETKSNKAATEARTQFLVGKNFFRVRDYKRAVSYLQECLDVLRKDNFFVNENVIPVSRQTMTAGLAAKGMTDSSTKSGDELELKYMLGRAYFELYKQDKDVENLKKAAALVRRAYCFVILRNANEMGKNQRSGKGAYTLTFKEEIELYYLDTIDTMIAIFLELHNLKGPKVDYPPFVDQFNIWLDPDVKGADGKIKLQEMPASEADYLWRAKRIHFDQWTSFAQLSDHPFRPEWRRSLRAWGDLTLDWLKKYGKEGKGIKEVDSEAKVTGEVQTVLDILWNKSLASLGYDDDDTKAFKKGLRDCAEKIEARAKELKLNIKPMGK